MMTWKAVNPGEGYVATTTPETGYIPHTPHPEMAAGRFNSWLEKTSWDHRKITAQAEALMLAHQGISKPDDVSNRHSH